MVKREELLKILDKNNSGDVVNFVQECRAAGVNCLVETFGSCSRKQLDHIWDSLIKIVSQNLHVEDLVNDETSSEMLKILECVTSLLSAMLAQTDVYVPEAMLQMATTLQGLLPSIPSSKDKIKNGLTRVYEDWWKKHLPNKEHLIVTSFMYILERSVNLKPKPVIADVKRVWFLHDVVLLIDLNSASSVDFKSLLQRCYISPQYMLNDEGIKFLGYLMTLDGDFTGIVHSTIKNHLLSVPRSWSEKYGEIYFRAWQSGSLTQQIEEECIQDLIYHAVHAQPVLAPMLRRLLSYIHHQKKLKGVDSLLYRLYGPIIWRSLRVANHHVRENAVALFFDMFPMQDPELPVQQADALLQKQFDILHELLDDPFPSVRKTSVYGIFGVMNTYWEVIPHETLKHLMVKLIQDMLKDASSADVREMVIKGLSLLLDNPLSHPFLKPILPELRNSFHDVSERVRVAMLDLLKKVKSLRTLKYWNIVPIEHLLARLVTDTEPVNKRIMKLIFESFVPIQLGSDIQLERCITLIESNPAAARQVFIYAPQFMSIEDTVRYMSMLCVAVLRAIRGAESEDTENINKDNEEDADDDDDLLHVSNTAVMKGLIEAMCLLWTVIDSNLGKATNAHLNKQLQKKFSYALPEMVRAFTDRDIMQVLIQIAAFLPPTFIPTLSRTWLPKLRNMTSEDTEEDFGKFILPLCKNGRGADIIELIMEWLTPMLGSDSTESTSKKKSKSKRVGFVEPKQPQPRLGLDMLSFLMKNPASQEIVLRDHLLDVVAMKNVLHGCLNKIEKHLSGESVSDVDILLLAFTQYCKLSLLQYIKNEQDTDCRREFEGLMEWTDKHVCPVLGVKVESDAQINVTKHKKLAFDIISALLNVMNNMMLVGIGDCSICTKLVEFCTTCLVTDEELELLPLVMLCLYQVSEFMQFSSDTENEVSHIIPASLSRILVLIARYVKQNKGKSSKLLGSVKVHFIEMMKAIFCHLSLDSSLTHDVMGTIMAAILAEVAFYSQTEDLGEETTELPPLSGWLLDILSKKAGVYRHFLEELTDCCESGAVSDIHKTHGAVFVMYCIAKDKKQLSGLKELWTILSVQCDKLKHEMNEDQTMEYKSVITALDEKLKSCQRLLNMAS